MLLSLGVFGVRHPYQAPEGEGSGGGSDGDKSGNGGGDDFQKKIDEATSGLKRTNEELKAEKKALKEQFDSLKSQLDSLGGADGIKQLQELNERFSKDELGKLLKEGKHDEWFDRRAKSLRDEHAKQLSQFEGKVKAAEDRAAAAEKRLHSMLLKAAVQAAAVKAGVEPTALDDIELHAEKRFVFDVERESLVMKDNDGVIVFGKDGKSPKSVEEWLEEQREPRRHWWPASKSGGASGSGHGAGSKPGYSTDFNEFVKQREKETART